MLTNHVILVLDRSGSMSYLRDQVKQEVSNIAKHLQTEAKRTKQKTKLSLFTFADNTTPVFMNKDIKKFTELTREQYYTGGSTALIDAVYKAIESGKDSDEYVDDDVSFLVLVLTDGYENASYIRSATQLNQLMREVTKTDKWTITFQVPPGHKDTLVKNWKIPAGNVREWEATEKGLSDTTVCTNFSLTNYYTARNAGQKNVKNFFVDVSKLTTSKLDKLDDVSNEYHLFKVAKEDKIKTFVERRTKKPYVKGSVYYLLQTPAVIQNYKEVIVLDKKTNKLYAGDQARQLIGLPNDTNVKADILNLSHYNLYVQSTSVNRILPRGSQVLVKKQ